jgi:Transport and Golgi organisation 2
MCTVTWMRNREGYTLFCNRDERDTRKPAAGPCIRELHGVSFVAPVDGDHGGSWIGVNQFGLTLCLLNRYGDPNFDPNRMYRSRGLLLTDLLDCKQDQIRNRLREIGANSYRAFTMLALGVNAPAMLVEWDGNQLQVNENAEEYVPLTSTSVLEPGIAVQRQKLFAEMKSGTDGITTQLLDRFHRSHVPERGAYSVCMHREGAATVSLSEVNVAREKVEFIYRPGSPCLATAEETVSIRRSKHCE